MCAIAGTGPAVQLPSARAPGDPARHARIAADPVQHLLGERVTRLVHDSAYATDPDPHLNAEALTVRQANEAGRLGAVD